MNINERAKHTDQSERVKGFTWYSAMIISNGAIEPTPLQGAMDDPKNGRNESVQMIV